MLCDHKRGIQNVDISFFCQVLFEIFLIIFNFLIILNLAEETCCVIEDYAVHREFSE